MKHPRKLKYVIDRNGFPILFTEAMQHSDFKHFGPISAGFYKLIPTKDEQGNLYTEAVAYGESLSLKMKSQVGDDKLIEFVCNESY